MDGRALRTFVMTFAAAALGLTVAWLAADGLANLDEMMVVAGPGGDLGRAAASHYAALVRIHGWATFLPIALGSAPVAVARARRPGPIS